MNWNKKEVSPQSVKELSTRYGLDLLTASILTRRGLTDPAELLFFLEDDPRYLRNPFLFAQMEDAVDRILLAADEGEKVLVFGDRDTDGVTEHRPHGRGPAASSGIEAGWRVPARTEKPTASPSPAVEAFAAEGGTLIVTVDCGISNHAEIERAAELGVDVIVADHHRLQAGDPPPALAVHRPQARDSGYPFRDLAGCGVVYKLASALKLASTGIYKQQIALLNVRPVNDAYLVEAVRLSNLVETGRVSETIVPGMVDLERTRLVPFLQRQADLRLGRRAPAPPPREGPRQGRGGPLLRPGARCGASTYRRPGGRASQAQGALQIGRYAIGRPRGDRRPREPLHLLRAQEGRLVRRGRPRSGSSSSPWGR